MKGLLILIGWCFLSLVQLNAQSTVVDYGPVFPQDEVVTIRITIPPDTLETLIETGMNGDDREFMADFRFESDGLTQTIQQVGFRLRGNTSIMAQKKSFKISFNSFVQGGSWQGLQKINLNGSHNDPSRIRAKLSWDLIREAGLPACRTNFVKLYINDEYRGLYTHVEHIDEQFAEKVIDGNGNGNLYKCLYPAPLTFLGNSPEAYKLESAGRRVYDLNNNQYLDDYSDLANFITILNQTPIEELPCSLEAVFNVDQYLRQAAMDVLLGNWDGYAYNNNNFYLYHNQITGLMEFIAYDVDNTLGIDWMGQDWTERNVYTWPPSQAQRPLFKRLLQIPEYRQQYSHYLRWYCETLFNPDSIAQRANTFINLISEAVQNDPYHSADYGFSVNDFQQSVDQAWGGHVDFGIRPYIEARKNSALSQADQAFQQQLITGVWLDYDLPYGGSGLAFASVVNGPNTVTWQYKVPGGEWIDGATLLDHGIFPDAVAFDGIYSGEIPELPEVESIQYRVAFASGDFVAPCAGKTLFLAESAHQLVINEVMADNSSVIADELGQYDDWIEIWNAGNSAINLGGKYLTDDQDEPFKFALPNVTLGAGQFALFWADRDENFARNHTNFSLSASGETLWLITKEQNAPRFIDSVSFPPSTEDVSYGRIQDGSSVWIDFSNPTPNSSNHITGLESFSTPGFYVYPNPTRLRLNLSVYATEIEVLDLTGRIVYSRPGGNFVDVSHLKPGLYLLKTDKGVSKFLRSEQ